MQHLIICVNPYGHQHRLSIFSVKVGAVDAYQGAITIEAFDRRAAPPEYALELIGVGRETIFPNTTQPRYWDCLGTTGPCRGQDAV